MAGNLHLTEVGRVALPAADQPVPPMFRLRDPNGNSLTIVEPLD
jgi:hypothetical protein